MQKQMPYVISYTETDLKTDKTKRVTRVILTTMETSRSGKQSIKCKTSWDDSAFSTFDEIKPANENHSEMERCYYFWDCMHYGTLMAIEDILEDVADYIQMDYFIKNLPKPDYSKEARSSLNPGYFGRLAKAFPELNFEVFEGF